MREAEHGAVGSAPVLVHHLRLTVLLGDERFLGALTRVAKPLEWFAYRIA